jgi:hypothetical protein
MMGFLKEMALTGCFQTKISKKRAEGGVHRPFSPKATAMRRPLAGPDCPQKAEADMA